MTIKHWQGWLRFAVCGLRFAVCGLLVGVLWDGVGEVGASTLKLHQRLTPQLQQRLKAQNAMAGIELLDLKHDAAHEMQAYLMAAANAYVFEEGKVIVQPGEAISSMLIIYKGSVRSSLCVVL